jgi:hypothetical protein
MIPVNADKQRSQELIDAVNQSHQAIEIAGQHGNAI